MNNLSWNDDEQMLFYQNLRKLPLSQQGLALLERAEQLLVESSSENDEILKAVESMLNLWTLRYSDPELEKRANKNLSLVYEKMGLAEKAGTFK